MSTQPYADGAAAYWNSKFWRQVIPIKRGEVKKPRVSGFSGYDQKPVTRRKVIEWREDFPRCNVGLVLPPGILVLDVDAYDGKCGAETLAALEAELGVLPPTVGNGNRPGRSWHLWFRVPETVDRWPGEAGKHVDVLWRNNRYAVVWPSIHHSGRPYRWTLPTGDLAPEGWIPSLDALAPLPGPWVTELALRAVQGPSVTPADASDFEADLALVGLGRWLRDQPHGNHQNALHWALNRALDGGLDPNKAGPVLWQCAVDAGLAERRASEVTARVLGVLL